MRKRSRVNAGCLVRFPAKSNLVPTFFSSKRAVISLLDKFASSLTVSRYPNQEGFVPGVAFGNIKYLSNPSANRRLEI